MKKHTSKSISVHNSKRKLISWGGISTAVILGLILTFTFLQSAKATGLAQEDVEEPPISEVPDAILANLDVTTVVDTPLENNLVQPGGQLTYTIRYTNTTGSVISNVIISSTLSDTYAWDPATEYPDDLQDFDGSYTASPPIPIEQYTQTGPWGMQWELPTLAANASGQIVIHTTVLTRPEPLADKSPIFLGNAVKIFSSQPEITGNQDDTVAVLAGPLLELTKIATPNPVFPGHILYYTITVANIARQDSIAATNLVISDTLPPNTSFYEAQQGGVFEEEENAVVWHPTEPLDPGESIQLNFRVIVSLEARTGSSINNSRLAYTASSSEIKIKPITGKQNANVNVAALLQKVAAAHTMNGRTPEVFPTEEVTYTVTIYNPLNTTLTGVAVTDTLPGNPDPFEYVRAANGDPEPEISGDASELSWQVDLPPWGSVTRSFVVRIPRNTFINANADATVYVNTLNGYHPDAVYREENNLAPVRVKAAMVMEKIVRITNPQPGITIFYTITLENRGPFVMSSIRLTDTIEGIEDRQTEFLYMTIGPEPLEEYNVNPIVWEGLSVNQGESIEIAFAARADGIWLQNYCNGLKASSPDAYIPERTKLACIRIDPPIKINKTVAPSTIYPGQLVDYSITLYNESQTGETFEFDEVRDTLPEGFFEIIDGEVGERIAYIKPDPPEQITPGGEWSDDFQARIVHIGDFECSNLPRVYRNNAGNINVHFIQPFDFWAANATSLAPLTVNPHVLVDLIPFRRTVPPGSAVTYTLSLYNQSPTTLNYVELVLTLPTHQYYTPIYEATLEGPEPSVNGQVLTWSSLTLPANSETNLVFLIRIPDAPEGIDPIPTGTLVPTFIGSSPDGCIGRLGTGGAPLGNGSITVDPFPVALYKRTTTPWVAPVSLVEYRLQIQNKDAYPFTIDEIIDTIPPDFTYEGMIEGPDPIENEATRQLIWNDVNIPAGGVTWRLQLRSAELYGEYVNELSASDDQLEIQPPQNPVSQRTVTVIPNVSIVKRSAIDHTTTGGTAPYTITLVNLGSTFYTDVTITDTLPTGFTYLRMLPKPNGGTYPTPSSVGEGNTQPVWEGLNLPGNCGPNGCIIELAFEARVGYIPEDIYYNNIEAYSPSGSIPNVGPSAPISVTGGTLPPDKSKTIYLPLITR